jgi:glycosyltransferase involved in cell wall biosynthesis
VQYLPVVAADDVERWRRAWSADDRPVVLFAGQLREDKCLDVLIDAVDRSGTAAKLAVVGGNESDAGPYQQLASERQLPVSWSFGFHPLEDFVAAITAADVVVCPYSQASQSGVLSIAHQLGVATVATDVGGLGELADAVVPPGDADALARAIDEALSAPPTATTNGYEEMARAAHFAAYGFGAHKNGGTP